MKAYKQISVSQETAKKIGKLKEHYALKGTPLSSPAIVGVAVNNLATEQQIETNG